MLGGGGEQEHLQHQILHVLWSRGLYLSISVMSPPSSRRWVLSRCWCKNFFICPDVVKTPRKTCARWVVSSLPNWVRDGRYVCSCCLHLLPPPWHHQSAGSRSPRRCFCCHWEISFPGNYKLRCWGTELMLRRPRTWHPCPLPPLVDSQTTALCLCPAYRQKVKQSKAVTEQVERFSLDAQSILPFRVALGCSQDWGHTGGVLCQHPGMSCLDIRRHLPKELDEPPGGLRSARSRLIPVTGKSCPVWRRGI